MSGLIDVLKKLQALDSERFRLHREQQEIPRQLEAARQRFAAEEEKLKACDERVKTLQLEQKRKEVELQAREGQIMKLQGQLVQLKTNREYSAMQHEIDALKTDNSLMEEIIIGVLDGIDAAVNERKAQEARVQEQKALLEQEKARIDKELSSIEQELGRLERDRKTILPDVDAKSLEAYERVLSFREGLALVPVVNESCGGCDRRLTPQVLSQVQLNASLVICEICNRILHKPEDA